MNPRLAERLRHHADWRALLPWRRPVEWVALLILAGYLLARVLGAVGWRSWLGAALVAFAFYYLFRFWRVWRPRLLWRLRNRLLVTYVFIAVVPILLVAAMVVLTAYLLYGQLAGYLITTDLQERARLLGGINQALARELQLRISPADPEASQVIELLGRERTELETTFPGLQAVLAWRDFLIRLPSAREELACQSQPAWLGEHFQGIVLHERRLFLHTVTRLAGEPRGAFCLTAPVNETLLDTVARDVGAFNLLFPLEANERQLAEREGPVFVLEGYAFHRRNSVAPATPRTLPAANRFDYEFTGLSKFNAVAWQPQASTRTELPVLISLTTRPSLLNRHVFGTLGEAITVPLALLVVFGVIFIMLEAFSFVTGVRLTRSITIAISELYAATRRIQVGDFSARVRHQRRDQLGELADSFNLMAASVERLIEESKERQRLENELEIARQVQHELFPRYTPQLATLELVGVCQPARVVSGDYYDYALLAPGRLVLAIGDISGKGISAALLMATIQAALRSQLYAARTRGQTASLSTAQLVARLNHQLCATTSMEKYASLFCAFYDEAERKLTYTNAGHLPPVVLRPDGLQQLEVGGPVVGLFSDASYAEASVGLEPGNLFAAFTDGLTEAENAYGEELTAERLLRVIQRQALAASPAELAMAVLEEVRTWVGTAEQADDMTLLVARIR